MSLKVSKDWLAAPVSMYATLPARKRRKRPSVTKEEQFVRCLGRHGSFHLIEIRVRGKPSLRYVRQSPSTPDDNDSVTVVTATE